LALVWCWSVESDDCNRRACQKIFSSKEFNFCFVKNLPQIGTKNELFELNKVFSFYPLKILAFLESRMKIMFTWKFINAESWSMFLRNVHAAACHSKVRHGFSREKTGLALKKGSYIQRMFSVKLSSSTQRESLSGKENI
jgi:hypothetical protein